MQRKFDLFINNVFVVEEIKSLEWWESIAKFLTFSNLFMSVQWPLFFFYLFIESVVCMLILTVVIAAITLVERKTLALVQRRVGPNQTAFRGRFQFIADAFKLLNKSIIVLKDNKRTYFIMWPMLALVAAYLFWINAVWGPNLGMSSTEYNVLIMGFFSFFFSLAILLVSIYSRDKYCVLAALRSATLTATLELVWGVFVLLLVWYLNSFSFTSVVSVTSSTFLLIFCFAPALPLIVLIFLLEAARIPFDLVEAESELVAGYTNELSGFFFALFYLGEYFHLFFASLFFSILFLGF